MRAIGGRRTGSAMARHDDREPRSGSEASAEAALPGPAGIQSPDELLPLKDGRKTQDGFGHRLEDVDAARPHSNRPFLQT